MDTRNDGYVYIPVIALILIIISIVCLNIFTFDSNSNDDYSDDYSDEYTDSDEYADCVLNFIVDDESYVEISVDEWSKDNFNEPSKAGYSFSGWSLSSNQVTIWDYDTSSLSGNVNLYAVWEAVEYGITYNLDGGTNSELNPSSYTYESGKITLSDPTKEGYTFVGWYNSNGDKVTEIADGATDTIEITATWVAIKTVNWIVNGETIATIYYNEGEDVPVSSEYDTETYGVPTKTVTGYTYTFDGWETIETSDNNTVVYEAMFISTINVYTITFVNESSETVGTATYTVENTAVTDPTVPTKTGYIVTWESYTIDTSSPTSFTVKAVYSTEIYTISYELDGGSNAAGNPTSYTVESETITLDDPTKTGYTFVCWTEGATITSGSTGEKTFTATWVETFDITYVLYNSGINDNSNPQYYCVGDTLALQNAVSTEEDYTFGGWYLDEDFTVYFNETSIDKNTTLYANWVMDFEYSEAQTVAIDGLSNASGSATSTISVAGIGGVTGEKIIISSSYFGAVINSIDRSAFARCSFITSVEIADSVTSIGTFAFFGCTSIESMILPFVGENADGTGNTYFGYIFGDSGYLTESEAITNIPSTLTSVTVASGAIAAYAFQYVKSITDITLADGVTSIGSYAFAGSSNNPTSLTRVIIGDGVTSIDYCAFNQCTNLTSVDIGDGVLTIGERAFSNCSSLTSVEIPDSVTSIESWAFMFCENLTSVVIPDSVESIGSHTFYYCTLLFSAVIGESVVDIGDSAFYMCNNLVEICNLSDLDIIKGNSDNGYAGYYAINIYTDTEGASKLSTDSDGFMLYTDGDDVKLIKYVGTATDVVIPSTVTEIYGYSFYYNENITSVTMGDSVKSIGDYAFYICTNLTNLVIGDKVESIGAWVFYKCTSLTSIVIPNSVESIGTYAFSYCSGISTIEIPSSITSISSFTFENCHGLTSVVIGENVGSIGSFAFRFCYRLVEIYNLSAALTIEVSSSSDNGYIGYYAISVYTEYTSKLSTDSNGFVLYTNGEEVILVDYIGTAKDITIPSTVTAIDQYAFYYNENITSVIMEDSVTSIDSYAFYYCQKLTSVVIGDNVTSIGSYAFSGCISLTSIIIPDNVESIGQYAFRYCYNIISVVIGDNVTSIDSNAFNSCYRLIEIYNLSSLTITAGSSDNGYIGYYAINVYTDAVGESKLSIDSNGFILYTDGEDVKLVGYQGTATDIIIPSTVTEIYQYAFYYNDKITSLVIGDNVTSIGIWSFNSCTSLTSVIIGDNVESIDSYAFYNCLSLTSITIGESVTSLGSYAFFYCSSLMDVYYNGSMGDWCNITFGTEYSNPMYHASNLYIKDSSGKYNLLTELVIPDTVTAINNYAFYGFIHLISVVIADSVESIGEKAFYECISLTSVVIADSVESIGEKAFYNCTSLVSVVIPDSVISIGSCAFYNCIRITSVVIGNGVTSIGSYAFCNCTSLQTLIIGNENSTANNVSLGSSAFQYCTNLTDIYIYSNLTTPSTYASYAPFRFAGNASATINLIIGDNVTSIGQCVFYYFENLDTVIIGNNVESIGSYAFGNCVTLTSVVIGNNVATISDNAFSNCNKLVEVYNLSDLSITAGSSDNGYVGYYALNVYTDTEGESTLSTDSNGFILCANGEDVILVGYTGSATDITIPSTVTAIQEYAFYSCTNITSVIMGDSVTSIGSYAFYNCSNLTSVVIGDNVISIGNWAFRNCTSLISIVIPDSVESIGTYVFNYCSSLTSVVIGSSVESIGQYSFNNCDNLTSVTFSDTDTWYVTTNTTNWENKSDGTKIDISDSATAFTYITSTYAKNYWYKSDFVIDEVNDA